MNPLSEFFENAQATSQLAPKFYWLTSAVGILVCLVAAAVMYVSAFALGAVLGLEPDDPIRESPEGILWAVLFLLAIPLSVAFAMIPLAWFCGLLLVRMGYMRPEEVKYYALRSRYPKHWYKNQHASSASERDAA
jgi:hypothetical protein